VVTPGSNIALQAGAELCPACKANRVQKISLVPLALDDLDRAVALRRAAASPSEEFHVMEAEATYLQHLSSGSGSTSTTTHVSATDNERQRTGRWTAEEIAFVDCLVDSFNRGILPIPHGVRLNDFLGGMLMCKGSRLTKKMKNARLSSRSYELSRQPTTTEHGAMLSSLQDKFVMSIVNEATRLELRFHLTKIWRTHFSNFCLQANSPVLDANDWINSLEVMESRAAQAEETVRQARRRRMGLALKTDTRNEQDGVFFGGIPMQNALGQARATGASSSNLSTVTKSSGATTMPDELSYMGDGADNEIISQILNIGNDSSKAGFGSDPVEFSNMFTDLLDATPAESSSQLLSNNCGSFLDEIVGFIEKHDLPFQHVDVWVPSESPSSATGELRLYHAGHATRRDLPTSRFHQLYEYGTYSTKFSFANGVGLPGRVYMHNRASWERNLDTADPKLFERAGGANVYEIKTGLGLPVKTKAIGRIVLVLYSSEDLNEDRGIIQDCLKCMQSYSPEPMWKLVVEMADSTSKSSPVLQASAGGLIHNDYAQPSASGHVANPTPGVYRPFAVAHDSSPPMHGQVGNNPETASTPVTPKIESYDVQEEEHRIATLLGDHAPLSEMSLEGETTSGGMDPSQLLPCFMSLRLLLLRSANRRTAAECEKLDVIMRSYRNYSQDKRRTDKDLAFLLVQDWFYLTQHEQQTADQHKCYVMNSPAQSTYSASGQPTKMPFCFIPPAMKRNSSVTSMGSGYSSTGDLKRRRVSSITDHMNYGESSV